MQKASEPIEKKLVGSQELMSDQADDVDVELPEWAEEICLNFDNYRYIALHGGRGSSKSWTIAHLIVMRMAQYPTRVMCGREVQKSIKDSVKKLIDDVIDRLGFRSMFHSIDNEIRGKNGSNCIFVGVRHDINSVKSAEGIDIFWGEEAQTFSQNSLAVIKPTIRKEGSVLIFTWNPLSPKDPIEQLFRGEDGAPPRTFIREVNWRDNPWFPEELREEMEHDKKMDYGNYLHVWEGKFLTRSNANVFQNWRVEEFEAPRDAFFRFGCDWGFSVDPTCLIRCYKYGARDLFFDYEAYQVGCEIDDTPALFATVPKSDEYPIIADSASPERISYMRKHGYPKMMKALKGRRSIEEGIAFMQSHNIIVHPRCKHLIEELSSYKYKIDPQTEEITSVLEDKNNHLCVAEGTLVITKRGHVKIEEVTTDDLVLTRCGYERVLAKWDLGNRDVIRVFSSFSYVDCTPDHKILTSRGWLPAETVRYNDDLLCIKEKPWRQRFLFGMGWSINATQNLSQGLIEYISRDHSKVGLPSYTEMYGRSTMVQFPRGCTFITLMKTQVIITLKILSASLLLIMLKGIGMMSVSVGKFNTSKGLTIWQSLGTLLLKAENFIRRMLSKCIEPLEKGCSPRVVTSVEKTSKGMSMVIDFAQTNANQHGGEIKDWMMLTAHASTVGESLESINTVISHIAPERVPTKPCGLRGKRRVFDITVEGCHEFFANGILVENCDSARYALESVRRTVKAKTTPDFTPLPNVNFWGKK
jgi:phage terminase large subunit